VCERYSLVFPREKINTLKMAPSGSLILRLSGNSLVVTRFGRGAYGVRDGWPTAQLPFLALRILQSLGAIAVGTHSGLLPEVCTQHESFEGRSWQNS
jgi:hypothetical protein